MARFLVAVLALVAGSFSSSVFAVGTCYGTYSSGAAAMAACQSLMSHMPASCIFAGAPGSSSGACNSEVMVIWTNSSQPPAWAYQVGGGCPAGQVADATGLCVPDSGPSPGRQAAEDAARENAQSNGFDQAAQDAAASAAGATYDEWVAAGKTAEQAGQAAAASGFVAAVENITGRASGAIASASSSYDSCMAAGGLASGCGSAFNQVRSDLLGMGFDSTNPPTFCYGACDQGETGDNVIYTANIRGGWNVISNVGGVLEFGGTQDTITFGPTASGSTSFNNNQPSAAQVATGSTGTAGGKTIVQTGGDSPALVVTRSDGVTEVYYFDSVTHEQDAKATVQSNGQTSCTGDCTGKQPINDVLAAAGGGVPGGSAGGSGLSGADSANLKRIADLLSGGGDMGGINDQKASFDGSLAALEGAVRGVETSAMPSSGWSWMPFIPSSTCSPFQIPAWGGRVVEFDMCPIAQKIREMAGYALYLVTAFMLFGILTGKKETA